MIAGANSNNIKDQGILKMFFVEKERKKKGGGKAVD